MYLSSLNAQADDHPEPDALLREEMEQFQNQIREYVISLIVFIVLYLCSAALIEFYRRKSEDDDDDDEHNVQVTRDRLPVVFRYRSASTSSATARAVNAGAASNVDYDEDVIVHRISIFLCKFSVAVSCGGVFLLPISIFGNEILFRFPDSYYVKWLNMSLLHTLWNLIFVLSNLSLLLLMPFAWLFTEAEGFVGSRRGLWSRFKETCVVLFILIILVVGLAFVSLAIFADDVDAKASLFDVWDFYLPRLYSCVSLIGVLILLICTPMGFARIFTVVGQLVVKPRFLRDLDNEVAIVRFEEESLKRKKLEAEMKLHRGGCGAGEGVAKINGRWSDRAASVSPARTTPYDSDPSPESLRHHHHLQHRLTNRNFVASSSKLNQSFDHLDIPTNVHSDLRHVRSPYSPPIVKSQQQQNFSRDFCASAYSSSSSSPSYSVVADCTTTSCAGSRSDYQIAYCAATSQLRNAKSETRVYGGGTNARDYDHASGGFLYNRATSSSGTPNGKINGIKSYSNCDLVIEGDEKMSIKDLTDRLEQVQKERHALESQQARPKWQRNLIYPVIMLALLLLTSLSVLMVFANVLELVMGYKALPGDGTVHNLGASSSSSFFGSIGSVVQVIVIFYVMGASVVGLHSAPGIRSIAPKPNDTPLTDIIANATLILVLSSAQPLLARTLGLTNFDLLGDYRDIRWLRHFYIVLLYNLAFAGATAWCLLNKITGPVRQELYTRLGSAFTTPAGAHRYANPVSWMYFVRLPSFPFAASKNKQG